MPYAFSLSIICFCWQVRGFLSQPKLDVALTGMDLVIIPTGVPRKPGMTRDDIHKMQILLGIWVITIAKF